MGDTTGNENARPCSAQKKKRCSFCRKKCATPHECGYCHTEVCVSCILPEVHNCENIENMKSKKRDVLAGKLLEERDQFVDKNRKHRYIAC